MVVRCVPGLERVVMTELRALSVSSRLVSPGTVFARSVSNRELYASNALMRTASRILVPACSFTARTFPELELAVKRLKREEPLSTMLIPGAELSIRVRAGASAPLFHTKAVASRLQQHLRVSKGPAMRFRSGDPEPAKPPMQRIDVIIEGEWVKILVDASGDSLHDRGWRADRSAKMPLKESVAAGMLLSAGWDASFGEGRGGDADGPSTSYGALMDPFCGSGAIPIEAALIAIGMPAHLLSGRSFALQHWPAFEPGTWGSVMGEMKMLAAKADARRGSVPPILGSDRDAGAVEAAKTSAAAAGVADLVEFRHGSVSDLTPPAPLRGLTFALPGLLLTNPPWGVRSGSKGSKGSKEKEASSSSSEPKSADSKSETRSHLYMKLGQLHKQKLEGWGLAVLVNDKRMGRSVSKNLYPGLEVDAGGQKATLVASPNVHAAAPPTLMEAIPRGRPKPKGEDEEVAGGTSAAAGATVSSGEDRHAALAS